MPTAGVQHIVFVADDIETTGFGLGRPQQFQEPSEGPGAHAFKLNAKLGFSADVAKQPSSAAALAGR